MGPIIPTVRSMSSPVTCSLILLFECSAAFGDVFAYEGTVLPGDAGWDVFQEFCDPVMWIEDGAFHVSVDFCPPYPPPGGQTVTYTHNLEAYVDQGPFFVEWRVESDVNRSAIPFGGCATMAVGSFGPTNYTFQIARDQVQLNRDNELPIVCVGIEARVPHTYRLEQYGETHYVWYIDGLVADSGVPESAFPSWSPMIVWETAVAYLPNSATWDYIRYGTIPADGSGDYDSDEFVNQFDYHYAQECLATGGPNVDSGPGCTFVDSDGDGDTDLADFAQFQIAFSTDR